LTGFPVLLDQRFAIEPYWPSFRHSAGALYARFIGCPTYLALALWQSAEGDRAWPPDAAPTGKTQ